MNLKPTLLAAAALSLISTTASAVDWGGYFRVGPGQKENSGEHARCFNGLGIGGKGGIGRLGNECDTYGEFALSQGAKAGSVDYKVTAMTNFYRPGSDIGGEKIGLNQLFVEGKGFDVAPAQSFWIGKRFYGRSDVHFDDTFFVNMSGTGAGVDGIGAGGMGGLNIAVFRDDGDSTAAGNPGTRFNLDWVGINSNTGGKLRLSGVFTDFSGTGGESGFGLSLQHNQANIYNGFENVFFAQYAKGSAGLDMGFGGATSGSDTDGWRLVDAISWTKGPTTGQAMLQFGDYGLDGFKGKWTSIGGRMAHAFTNNFKLQGEVGYSTGKVEGGQSQNVTKLTIAPTLTVGPNYYDRPELRFYVSYFNFNDAYQARVGAEKSNRTTAGFQAEIWF